MLDPNVFLQNPAPDFKMNQLCKVCGEPAAGFHFGAFTCEGCKSFFGRTYNNVSGIAECKNGGRCEINKKNRTSCKSCRLRKCLRVGMSKSGSRYGRRSNWFKIHCLLQAQGQPNGMSPSPETNNNSSTTTNNRSSSPTYSSSFGKSPLSLPSTVTSFGDRERERERDREERERTPTSTSSRNGANGIPHGLTTSLSSLSPESLSSLNRKLNNSDLAEYFRAAGLGKGGIHGVGKPNTSMYSEDERGDDMSRTTRSPGSLESPRSEASMDEGKSSTPMFGMPPGSPLDVRQSDLLPFDLITRDLLKMGYDPLRLWPAMLTAQPNLHSFNPYRLMFPNFPAGAASAFPGGFPPNPNVIPPQLLNGAIHPAAKLFSVAGMSEGIPSPLANLPGNLAAAANLQGTRSHSHSPSSRNSPPIYPTSARSRGTPVVPPSSSITLTPPISHHGSDEPGIFPLQKPRTSSIPLQEKPIDLSAKSTNNNHVKIEYPDDVFTRKTAATNGELREGLLSRVGKCDASDEEESICDNDSDAEGDYNSDVDMKVVKSGSEESDKDEDVEDLSSSNNNNNLKNSASCASRSPSTSPKRASTPLDLTRGSGSSNPSPPVPKIAT